MYNLFAMAHFWSNRLVAPAWLHLFGPISAVAADTVDKAHSERRTPRDNLGVISECLRGAVWERTSK